MGSTGTIDGDDGGSNRSADVLVDLRRGISFYPSASVRLR